MSSNDHEARYAISVAARLVGVHAQTLRYYERAGLLDPARSDGNIRLYSRDDIERALQIRRFIEDLGVNLAGVEVILRLRRQLDEMDARVQELLAEVQRLREREDDT